MRMRGSKPKLTEAEVELLTILWDKGPATVREIFENVNATRRVVYTGILKTLQRMAEKKLVGRDESDRTHVYRAIVSRAEAEEHLIADLSERFFAGSTGKLAIRALELERASKDDLAAIQKLIDEKAAELD